MSVYIGQHYRFTDLEDEFMVASGEGWGKGIVRECGIHMYILLYVKWIKTSFYCISTGNCSMLCGSLMRGEFGGEWIHVYVWQSPFAVLLKLAQLC